MFWLLLMSLISISTALIILLALTSAARHDRERIVAVRHLQADTVVNAEDTAHDDMLHPYMPLMTDRQPAYST